MSDSIWSVLAESEREQWEHTVLQDRGLDEEIRFSQEGTYRVLAAPAWVERLGDTPEGPLPAREWHSN
ncbi:hypothetical protein BX285_6890 [Streptomyces sp. 1114.5]|uniref:hypothetical protein n=1 Tax=Streptomyces sp. 1114.5 TaxID=1938830 RepID=UPI000EB3F0F5|nr:hypothetical protein [Streptomyces sp. 1114.5]RKT09785.1 hypothetical protein BX285_6890 [Streptomyces sp. 1114.5]